MTEGVIIRAAVAPDLAAVQAIYAHHVLTGLATFEEVPPDLAEITVRWETLVGAGLPWLVAADADGQVLGYAYAGPFKPRAAYRYCLEDSIYLAPGQTGRGLGRALLVALIERAEAGPWRQMVAVIGDSGNGGSIGVHRSCGFQPIGVLQAVGFKFGRWVDVVMMQRALGPGATALPGAPAP